MPFTEKIWGNNEEDAIAILKKRVKDAIIVITMNKLLVLMLVLSLFNSCCRKQIPATGKSILASHPDSYGFIPKSSGYVMMPDGISWRWIKLKK